jgi:hypothetical protein
MGMDVVKLSIKRNAILVASVVWLMASPSAASAKDKTEISQPLDEEVYTSVGDRVARVTIKESLPNAFGGSDIFGRKREKGFVELRYMGMTEDGRAVFRRRTVDVVSNETTMSRSQSLFGGSAINQSGSGANAAIIIEGNDGAGMEVLPPDTIEFALDITKHKTITVENYLIEIQTADPGGVSFVITERKRKR